MEERDIEDILKRAAEAPPQVNPALMESIAGSLGASLKAVRPLAPTPLLWAGVMAICLAVGLGGAMILGPHGVEKMSATQIAWIYPVLAMLTGLFAVVNVREVVPGSRRIAPPWLLTAVACLTLAAVFASVFHGYGMERFVAEGIKCLRAGVAHAVPAAIATWLLLRRGYAVNPVAAGVVRGALAGLAGVTMLELHCVILEAPHVLVWHVAVVPVSAALGAATVWIVRNRYV